MTLFGFDQTKYQIGPCSDGRKYLFHHFPDFHECDEDDESGEKEFFFDAYPEDFFDLIIVDECHRGGANDEHVAGFSAFLPSRPNRTDGHAQAHQ